ncbi:MAG: copper amine oxidase N-terminal domain-containing protein [Candidatus Cellulosilyticum pullistercoris]|uniref:Copper amine oxidase N-terminal domain-containing protein n=1 Tax=Candidatus Cellulosilyticum pullistercoris TaxID=2838521 RepID=A0A9E2KAN8_9FIRM|nr:copper amine oxidase N-terminal domain-containing protein [Candidatus Cellulosilyticum pullistercoris]
MKLRQKLAVVLASAMVVSAVPVVTMADTTNSLHNTIKVVKGSTMGYTTEKVTVGTTGTAYKIESSTRKISNLELHPKATYELNETKETFFVELENAEFSDEAFIQAYLNTEDGKFSELANLTGTATLLVAEAGTIDGTEFNGKKPAEVVKDLKLVYETEEGTLTITKTGKAQLRVDVQGKWTKEDTLIVPIFAKVTKANAVVVKVDGADSFVSDGSYTVGATNEDNTELSVAVDDAKTGITVDGGEISKLVLSEEVIGAIANSENRKVQIEISSSSDLEFSLKGIKATGKRGFYSKGEIEVGKDGFAVEYGTSGRNNNKDTQVIIVTLPNWVDGSARGQIELSGIKVVPTNKTASTGDVTVTISSVNDDDFIKEKDYVVGVVSEYGVTLTCDAPATIKAGRSAIVNKNYVKVQLKEAVKDSLVDDRTIEFTLENGYLFGAADMDFTGFKSMPKATSNAYKEVAMDTLNDLIKAKKVKFEDDAKGATVKDVEINAKGQVIGFTLENLVEVTQDEVNELTLTIPVATSLQSTGEVKLVATGRALAELGAEDELSCKVADVVSPVTVEAKAAELKVGLQAQTSGEIVIAETDKAMLQKGYIVVDAPEADGITFGTLPTVKAEGITLGEVSLNKAKTQLHIEVKRTSTEAGKITISDLEFTTSRAVPEGTFDVEFYGTALTDEVVADYTSVEPDTYVVEDFIKITTPNTEDIKTGALKAVTSTFKIGSSTYTVDGVENTMDAPAYLKDNRTMVPVRYIAYAFGLDTSNVLYANSTATIIAGEKIIQVTVGSDIMTVNGTQIKMDTKAELVNGRAYVPMKFIASALGVSASWDSASQTATFSNKN